MVTTFSIHFVVFTIQSLHFNFNNLCKHPQESESEGESDAELPQEEGDAEEPEKPEMSEEEKNQVLVRLYL